MSKQDTREKLEADIHKWTTCSWVTVSHEKVIDWLDRQAAITRNIERRMHDYILDNLERENDKLIAERNELKEQLRIEREAAGICNGCHYVDGVIAELTAERDELEAFSKRIETAAHDKLGVTLFGVDYVTEEFMLHVRDTLTAEVEKQRQRANEAERGALSDEWYVARDRYEDDVAALTAERDELRGAIDAMENGQFYAMYRRACEECDELRREHEQERQQMQRVIDTQRESFRKMEFELAQAKGGDHDEG